MRETLPAALDLAFGDEGGYVNAKTDRGGPTKYGITHKTLAAHRGVASVTAAQVKAMSRDEAAEIYIRSYWAQSGGDILPAGLDYAAFDFGINSGPARAVKSLQTVLKAAGVYPGAIDGHAGEQTAKAARVYPGGTSRLIRDYCDARMRFLKSLGGSQGFSANGRGWTIRVTGVDPKGAWTPQPGVLGNALRLASAHSAAPPAPTIVPAGIPAGQADARDTGLTTILRKPEAWGPLLSGFAGLGIFTGSGPLQWALAAAMIAGVAIGVWYVVRRVRESG